MNNDWLDEAKKRLRAEATKASDVPFDRLKTQGMINERGEVTGHLHRWSAFLAITGIKHDRNRKRIDFFRCLKPVFGMPGGATIDIRRETMLGYLKEGQEIITATRDKRLRLWMEGHSVHLSKLEFIRCDLSGDGADDVGELPEFRHPETRL